MTRSAILVIVAALAAARPAAASPSQVLTLPAFGDVSVYLPAGRPTDTVLFLSDDAGWSSGAASIAERLRDMGAIVAGVDVRVFRKSLAQGSGCAYPARPLEDLARHLHARYALPEYKPPILAGLSSGATMVYATLAAAPPTTFAGALSLAFCRDLEIQRPPCEVGGLEVTKLTGPRYEVKPDRLLDVPWMVLQGEGDRVCPAAAAQAFVAAVGGRSRYFALPRVGHGVAAAPGWERPLAEAVAGIRAARTAPPAAAPPVAAPLAVEPHAGTRPALGVSPAAEADAAAVAALSLAEVPVAAPAHDTMVVFLTGDGGWAELDRGVAAALAAQGVPTVGWSSLRYYWTPRTPDESAAALARIVRHYTAAWHVARVVLVGYSFGADVLPFLVNRLPADAAARIASIVLLAPSASAAFEFHLADWVGGAGDTRYPTAPEIQRLPVPATCVTGADDPDSICHTLAATPSVASVLVGRGHHFSGQYARLADVVLESNHLQ